jgi:hypothetical protein
MHSVETRTYTRWPVMCLFAGYWCSSSVFCVSCLKLFEITSRIALVYTTLCRDSVEYRAAIVLSELCVRSVSTPSTQIRGCSPLWIIHFQCACHQTRSTYCQPTITQTTLSTLPPAWHSVSSILPNLTVCYCVLCWKCVTIQIFGDDSNKSKFDPRGDWILLALVFPTKVSRALQ